MTSHRRDRRGHRRRAAAERRHWWRRAVVIAAVAALVVALAGASSATGLSARRHLLEARAELERGVAAVQEADATLAERHFRQARQEADAATAALESPLVRPIAAIPGFSTTARTGAAVARGAALVADAGLHIAGAVADVPGGLAGLAPEDGVLPLGLAGLAEPLEQAHDLLVLARDIVASAPGDTLLRQVDEARTSLLEELEGVLPRLERASALAAALPAFLGADGPKRYFLGAQNPAELRGTGGFMGAYAILSVDGGSLDVGSFAPIQDLPPHAEGRVPAPNPDYARRYELFGGSGFLLNVNATPDVPSAAQAILANYAASTGEQLDGVMLVDPFALQALMGVTGPTTVPEVGVVGPDDVIRVATTEARIALGGGGERKEVLGEVAAQVLEEFLSGAYEPQAQARAIAEAADEGHILLYARDPQIQDALERAGLAGSLLPAEPGALHVSGVNAGEDKLDYYTDRDVRYEVFLNPDGSGTALVDIALNNTAPPDLHVEITGSSFREFDPNPGDAVTVLSVFCGPCEHQSTTRDNEGFLDVSLEEELGHRVLETWEPMPQGETRDVSHVVRIPDLWRPNRDGADATLAFQEQVQINPTDLTVVVHPPGGWDLAPLRDDVMLEDGIATWTGNPAPLETFELDLVPIASPEAPSFIDRVRGLLP